MQCFQNSGFESAHNISSIAGNCIVSHDFCQKQMSTPVGRETA